MAREIVATTNEELERLPVHDQWLSLDDVRATEDGDLVFSMLIEDEEPCTLPPRTLLRFLHYAYRVPRHKAELRISSVLNHEVRDDARIGGTDVNGISMGAKAITITGNHPVTVRAEVSAPCVTLSVSDEIAGHIAYSVWFSQLFCSHPEDG